MSFNKKDRAIIAASALVGYCHSVPTRFSAISDEDQAVLQRWIDGLAVRTRAAATAIDEVFTEPTASQDAAGEGR